MVMEAVEQARGTFVIPYGPVIPQRLLDPFQSNKVVILDGDFTSQGLPSIRLFSDNCVEAVLDHLYELGHRHIDCINTQNRNPEIDRRIDIWKQWRIRNDIAGELQDDPAPVFSDPTIVAYRLMSRLLDKRRTDATAFVATTCPAAIGAIRACWERKIRVGHDLSICAINIEPPAEFFCPSITGLGYARSFRNPGRLLRMVRESQRSVARTSNLSNPKIRRSLRANPRGVLRRQSDREIERPPDEDIRYSFAAAGFLSLRSSISWRICSTTCGR